MRATRGAVLPIPALLAAAVVCAALSLYAATLHDRDPGQERSVVRPATDDALDRVSEAGVVEPSRLDEGLAAIPGGYQANLTVRAEGDRWSAGPAPPGDVSDSAARTATRAVTVRAGQGQLRPGEFEVALWS